MQEAHYEWLGIKHMQLSGDRSGDARANWTAEPLSHKLNDRDDSRSQPHRHYVHMQNREVER